MKAFLFFEGSIGEAFSGRFAIYGKLPAIRLFVTVLVCYFKNARKNAKDIFLYLLYKNISWEGDFIFLYIFV